jgi:hypothetical protein
MCQIPIPPFGGPCCRSGSSGRLVPSFNAVLCVDHHTETATIGQQLAHWPNRSTRRVMLAHQDSGDAGSCNVSTPAQSSGFSAREGGSGLHGMSCCRAIYSSASGCRASVGEGRLPSHVESTRASRSRTVRQQSLVVCLWSLLAPRVLQGARNGWLWSLLALPDAGKWRTG